LIASSVGNEEENNNKKTKTEKYKGKIKKRNEPVTK
jgi:hypothetical protein